MGKKVIKIAVMMLLCIAIPVTTSISASCLIELAIRGAILNDSGIDMQECILYSKYILMDII